MKAYLLAVLFISSIIWTSCCNVQHNSNPRIWITYTSTHNIYTVLQIRTVKGDVSQVIDTLRLRSANSYFDDRTPSITVEPIFVGEYDYLIAPLYYGRVDTITSVSHTRGKCNIMKEVAYLWNGNYSNDNHREITLP